MERRCSSTGKAKYQDIAPARASMRLSESASPLMRRRIRRGKRLETAEIATEITAEMNPREIRGLVRANSNANVSLARSFAREEKRNNVLHERMPSSTGTIARLSQERSISIEIQSRSPIDNNNDSRCMRFHERATRVLSCRSRARGDRTEKAIPLIILFLEQRFDR